MSSSRATFERKVTDRGDIVARAAELGASVEAGAGAIFARAAPRAAQTGDWRARVLVVALRALRGASSGTIAELVEIGDRAEVRAIVPVAEPALLERAIGGLQRELAASLSGFSRDARAQSLGRPTRPTSTAAAARRCSPPTSPRRTGSSCSRSRTPAPTGCCCPR